MRQRELHRLFDVQHLGPVAGPSRPPVLLGVGLQCTRILPRAGIFIPIIPNYLSAAIGSSFCTTLR